MAKDYYKTLGIEKSATPEEVKAAFRRLAMQHHPDRGGNEAKFKELNEAYQVLGDETKRKQYDQYGQVFEGGGPSTGGFGGFGAGGFEINIDDLFGGGLGDLFGTRGRRTRSQSGRDIHMETRLEFRDAVFGSERTVELYKPVTCERCSGNGGEPGAKVSQCGACRGSGKVATQQRTPFGVFQTVGVCRECQGEGKSVSEKCSRCAGTGITKESRTIKVKIPAGIHDGATIRITGEGEAGARGSGSGDLYLTVHVKADDGFGREGDDIVTSVPVSFADAALGTTIEVPTLDGMFSLKIPAGTQPATVLRLKGKGVPHLRSAGRGDHLITVVVEVPKKLSKKQKELLDSLRSLEE